MLRDQTKCQTAIMVEANTQREIVIVHLNSRNSIVCLHTLSLPVARSTVSLQHVKYKKRKPVFSWPSNPNHINQVVVLLLLQLHWSCAHTQLHLACWSPVSQSRFHFKNQVKVNFPSVQAIFVAMPQVLRFSVVIGNKAATSVVKLTRIRASVLVFVFTSSFFPSAKVNV